MPIRSSTITGLVAAVLIAGCGAGGDGGAHGEAPTATAPPAQTGTATDLPKTATTSPSTATTAKPSAGTTATEHAVAPARPRSRARLVAVCRRARERHPWPVRPVDRAALSAYATAALPAAQATFEALRRLRDVPHGAEALVTAYGALVSLYRQVARTTAARARQIAPALASVEGIVAEQAKRARAPACAPPGS